ncbi:MAG: hypothetical protein KJ607_07695 [Bacteroidetes bacterium]|nr:hypothetical protein [Bacteroidota bacterium]
MKDPKPKTQNPKPRKAPVIQKRTILFIAVLIASLIPYLYLSFFAHPVADDFYYAVRGKNTGLFETLTNEYLFWNGRYASNLLVLINPVKSNSLLLYRLVPVALIVFTIIACFIFIKQVVGKVFNRYEAVLLALILVLLNLNIMPCLSEGIYWYTGSVSYHLAAILTLPYLALLLRFFRRRYIVAKGFHLVLNCLLLFIVTGFNETIMLILLFIHVALCYYILKQKGDKIIVIYTFLMVCFACIMLFAPGNQQRAALFPEKYNLFKSLIFSIMQIVRFSSHWILCGTLLPASVLFLPVAVRLVHSGRFDFLIRILSPVTSAAILLMFLFLSIFPSYFTTGILGQHRTVNTGCFFFIIWWFVNLIICTGHFTKNGRTVPVIRGNINLAVIIFLFLAIEFTNNGYGVATDIIYGKEMDFDNEMKERYKLLESCNTAGLPSCSVPPLTVKPHALFVLDVTGDEDFIVDKGYLYYFLKEKGR